MRRTFIGVVLGLLPVGDKNYPVDKNNFSPRVGVSHSLDDAGKRNGARGFPRQAQLGMRFEF